MGLSQKFKDKLSEKSFQNWTQEDVFNYLQVVEIPKYPLLDEWIEDATQTIEITAIEQSQLQYLYENFAPFIEGWDEATLRYNFISPLISHVGLLSNKYRFANFWKVNISIDYQGISLKGNIESLVAMGVQKPRTPFFFIHEYKQQEGTGSKGDVVGQLVSTMVAAQVKNQLPRTPTVFNPNPKSFANQPIYGCYILGRYWHFVVLKGTQYATSRGYDARQWEDLQLIFKILKAEKQRIIKLLEDEPTFPMPAS